MLLHFFFSKCTPSPLTTDKPGCLAQRLEHNEREHQQTLNYVLLNEVTEWMLGPPCISSTVQCPHFGSSFKGNVPDRPPSLPFSSIRAVFSFSLSMPCHSIAEERCSWCTVFPGRSVSSQTEICSSSASADSKNDVTRKGVWTVSNPATRT